MLHCFPPKGFPQQLSFIFQLHHILLVIINSNTSEKGYTREEINSHHCDRWKYEEGIIFISAITLCFLRSLDSGSLQLQPGKHRKYLTFLLSGCWAFCSCNPPFTSLLVLRRAKTFFNLGSSSTFL